MSLSGPGAPPGTTKPDKVKVGLGHRGDEPVVILVIEKAGFLTPIAVALPWDEARQVNMQLAVAVSELGEVLVDELADAASAHKIAGEETFLVPGPFADLDGTEP